MKLFIKNHLYAIFVILLILLAGGAYLVKTDAPIVSVSSQQRQFVRHEKDENQLNAVERYFEKQLASHFTEQELKEIAITVIVAALILLICEPLILWFIYTGRKPKKHGADESADQQHHLIHHYQNPYRIDHDTDKDFKIF
ncbi:hypothetical protein [Lapidilactobacillus bayanensis]|uniref:hypothetical protein n=1 Tax=Lapidilactobacillus bayanensis TaxID=2485998 RepID=UPI000F7771EB|nr:hypothetical protein [Lapidilactobacillus bayanensis]